MILNKKQEPSNWFFKKKKKSLAVVKLPTLNSSFLDNTNIAINPNRLIFIKFEPLNNI